ncbi:hypothetical protein Tco_1461849 [Tanacetum coccineum]
MGCIESSNLTTPSSSSSEIFVDFVNFDMLIRGINNRLFSISGMISELHYVFCTPTVCKNASVGNVVSFISVKRRNFCVSEGRAIGGVVCSQASVNVLEEPPLYVPLHPYEGQLHTINYNL